MFGTIAPLRALVTSVLGCSEAALEHEQKNSESVRNLYRKADAAGDLDSPPLLSWFLSE